MINISLVFNFSEIQKQWVIYILFCQQTASVVFVGHCKLTQLFGFPDARQMLGNLDGNYILRVIESDDARTGAFKKYEDAIRAYGFIKQLAHARLKKHGNFIECVNTGERWSTLTEAANAHGIGAGNLSKHLRGLPGHVTVKGKTYRKVT